MIVSKTPLRVSFFGGGSDIPAFYNQHEGVVLSTTIDQYINIAVNTTSNPHVKLMYSQIEVEDSAAKLKHDRVREVLNFFGIDKHIEIASFADIPTRGTGLGSSSTFTVGLIHALSKYTGLELSRYDLAEIACYIEIDACGEPIGKQDQYAAAYGGMNVIRFNKHETTVTPVQMGSQALRELNNNLLCFNTGVNRQASSVLSEQVANLNANVNVDQTKRIVDIANTSIRYLLSGKYDDFGSLLHDTWAVKRQLASNISNDTIDDMYNSAMKAGALGGKLLGAGGGGYMLFYVPPKYQVQVIGSLIDYKQFRFNFTDQGSTI